MKNKICLILLIFIMFSTSACNDTMADVSTVSTTESVGEYFIEEQIQVQLPEGYIISKILKETPDGYYALSVNMKGQHFHGEENEPGKDEHDVNERNRIFYVTGGEAKAVWSGNCRAAAIDSKDQLYTFSEDKKDDETHFILNTYDQNFSKINTVKLKSPPKEHSVLVNDIAIYDDRISVIRVGGIQIFDFAGKVLFEKAYKTINNFTYDDKSLYLTEYPVYGGDTNRLFQLDVFDLKEKWSKEIQLIRDQIKILSYNPHDSKLYFILNNRLMTLEKDHLIEVCNLLDYKSGKLIAESAVSTEVSKITNYLKVQFQRDGSFALKLFSFDENYSFTYTLGEETNKNNTENYVNILLPLRDIDLEMVAARFENNNRDTKIRFSFHKEKGDISSQPEFVQFLNLKVLSGEQDWDIVPINFLPYWQYIQKGVLKDIGSLDVNNELSDADKYYVNLIDGCKIDNKLYYLPIYISFSAFAVDMNNENAEKVIQASKHWTWKDLQQLVTSWPSGSKPFEKHPLHGISVSLMIDQPYISGFFTEKTRDDDVKLLEACLSLVKDFKDPNLYSEKNGTMMPFLPVDWSLFATGAVQFSEGLRVLPVPTLENSDRRSFDVQRAYAINSKSANPSAALDFLKFLAQDSGWGYPGAIVKADREYIIHAMSNRLNISGDKVTPFVDSLLKTKESLNHADYFERGVWKIVDDIIEQYLKGSISKEQAARDIAQGVWLYTNE